MMYQGNSLSLLRPMTAQQAQNMLGVWDWLTYGPPSEMYLNHL